MKKKFDMDCDIVNFKGEKIDEYAADVWAENREDAEEKFVQMAKDFCTNYYDEYDLDNVRVEEVGQDVLLFKTSLFSEIDPQTKWTMTVKELMELLEDFDPDTPVNLANMHYANSHYHELLSDDVFLLSEYEEEEI